MFKTLFSKMLTIYLALALGMLIVLGVTMAGIFRGRYVSEREMEMRRECSALATVVASRYTSEERRAVAVEQLTNSARQYDSFIQLRFTDPSLGKVSFFDEDSRYKWASCDEVDLSKETETIMASDGTSIVMDMFSSLISFPTMTVFQTMKDDGGNALGVIFMHIDMTGLYESITQVYMDILLSALIAVFFATLAVFYITNIITRPIKLMNNTVMRFSRGDFDARIDMRGQDEVSQLGRSFNHMADELNTLEQARRSFVANVSHELRSPLTSMRGFLEAMSDGTIPKEEYGKYLNIVLSENRRMTSMVNDLLDLARIESGQSVLNITVFDINELLVRTLITFEAQINAKNIDMRLELAKNHSGVKADRDRITQVIRNLVDNAIKFSPEGGVLAVKTRFNGDSCYVSVKDNGAGISKEDLPYVFDRFYKAEKAHTPSNTSGTGLGLSIVRRILEQHGQDIFAESNVGEGACFTFTLKRAAQAKKRVSAPQAPKSAVNGDKN